MAKDCSGYCPFNNNNNDDDDDDDEEEEEEEEDGNSSVQFSMDLPHLLSLVLTTWLAGHAVDRSKPANDLVRCISMHKTSCQ